MKKNQYITPNTTVTAIMGAQSVFTAGFASNLGDSSSEGKDGSNALAKEVSDDDEFLDEEEELLNGKNAWTDGLW